MSRRVLLSEFKEKRTAERGIDIEAANGEVFHVPPPETWPDEVFGDSDPVAQAQKLWGEEKYAEYVAAGGTARLLAAIIEEGWDATIPE